MNPEQVSQPDPVVQVVLAFNQELNRHNVADMMHLMSEDCVFENTYPPPDGTQYAGKAAVTRFWEDFIRESPQARIEIEEIFSLGERCIMRWSYHWVDLDGQPGHVRGVDLYRVTDGLIREKLSYVKG